MALLIGVGLALALSYSLLVAVIRWVSLAGTEVRLPTHTWEVSLGGSCEPPPTVRFSGPSWVAGAPTTVQLVAGSRSHTGPSVVSGDSVSAIEIPYASAPRGLFQLRRLTVRITDLLSLFPVVLDFTVSGNPDTAVPILRVLPVASSVAGPPAPPGFMEGVRGEGLSRDRSDDLIEARPYHPGDDTRRIYWKAYAHSETLFVRLGEEIPPPSFRAHILVDTRGLASVADLDRLISAALGVAEQLARRAYTVTMGVEIDAGGPHTLGTVDEGRRTLAAVDPVYGILPETDRRGVRRSSAGAGHTLIVATGRSPAAPPGAEDAVLVWDHQQPEGGRHAWTISFLE